MWVVMTAHIQRTQTVTPPWLSAFHVMACYSDDHGHPMRAHNEAAGASRGRDRCLVEVGGARWTTSEGQTRRLRRGGRNSCEPAAHGGLPGRWPDRGCG